MRDPAFVEALEAGEADYLAGRVVSWEGIKARLSDVAMNVNEDRLVRARQKGLLGRDDKPVFPDTDE